MVLVRKDIEAIDQNNCIWVAWAPIAYIKPPSFDREKKCKNK
jgi:hypothetical protein